MARRQANPEHDQSEVFQTAGPAGTIALGRRLARRLGPGDLVAMTGELGAGKTVLVQGLAQGLGVSDKRAVSSPTFVLVQEYAGRCPVYHLDLYRMADAPMELAQLGLREMLADGVVLVEWAERAGESLPRPYWELCIMAEGPRRRRFELRRVV